MHRFDHDYILIIKFLNKQSIDKLFYYDCYLSNKINRTLITDHSMTDIFIPRHLNYNL